MKRATVSMALILFALLLVSVFTPPTAADRNKKHRVAGDSGKKETARPSKKRELELASLFMDQDPASPKQDKSALIPKITGKVRTENPDADLEPDADEQDPDLPAGMHGDKEAFFRARDEFIARLRGVEPGKPFDPLARGRAIQQMERRQNDIRQAAQNSEKLASG